jgi:CDP-paratose 2-epimerase
MKILITGVCGFVGGSLARFWIKNFPSDKIYGLDNFSRPGSEINRLELKRLGVNIFHGDLRLASDLETLPAVDFVIDSAAYPSVLGGINGRSTSRQIVEHNLLGTLQVLEYCKKHGSGLILLSTSRVYSILHLTALPLKMEGDAYTLDTEKPLPAEAGRQGITEHFSTNAPISLYGSTKLAAEVLALEYGDCFSLPIWINRCGVMAGETQFGHADQGIVAYWLHSWKQRRSLRYIGFGGKGYQTRDLMHPDDLAGLIAKQMNFTGKKERVVNVASDQTFSLRMLSSFCAQRWGSRNLESEQETRCFDVPWIVLDASLARSTWDWQPAISSIAILEEIARKAEAEPDWLALTAS